MSCSTKPYKKGVWYHVVGTYDGELMRLYQNGELVAESAEQTGPILYQGTHSLALCSYKDENESYPIVGAIHEVALYDKALKLADIKRRYKHLCALLARLRHCRRPPDEFYWRGGTYVLKP